MSKKVIHESGKRKSSVARATVTEGKGLIKINNVTIDNYEPKMYRMRIREPVIIAGEKAKKINIKVNVNGGGICGRADAARLAIGKAISKYFDDSSLNDALLAYDRTLLVADVRRKETSKPNCQGKARSKRQKSYR